MLAGVRAHGVDVGLVAAAAGIHGGASALRSERFSGFRDWDIPFSRHHKIKQSSVAILAQVRRDF